MTTPTTKLPSWTFLSTHGHVFLAVARHPDARVLDLGAAVGLSARAIQKILADLVAEGYLERVPNGRRTTYRVHPEQHFRHPTMADHEVGEMLEMFGVRLR